MCVGGEGALGWFWLLFLSDHSSAFLLSLYIYIFNLYISITVGIQLFYNSFRDTAKQLDISTMSFVFLSVKEEAL